jgi:hypothetical protein
MNEQHADRQATSGGAVHERCLCCEIMSHLRDCLGVSPAVQQHLTNSRVEFLKAVRTLLDTRIERLSKAGQQGTKISVE